MSIFDHKPPSHDKEPPSRLGHVPQQELLAILNARTLLADDTRETILKKIRAELPFKAEDFERYYQALIDRFTEFVQSIPETQSGYFSYRGGMLDLALKRAQLALSMYHHYLLPEGAERDHITEKQWLWIYVIFSAALLVEIGKIVVKFDLNICDRKGNITTHWNPFAGSMRQVSDQHHYHITFLEDNRTYLIRHITHILARQLMPDAGFQWIANDKDALSAWLSLLVNDTQGVSTLVTLIPLANSQIIAQFFEDRELSKHSDFVKDRREREHDLFHARDLEHEGELQDKERQDRIKEEAQERRSGRSVFADKIGKTLGKQLPAATVAATAFIHWVRKGIADGRLSVNKADSPVQITKQGALLDVKGALGKFSQENPRYGDLKNVVKGLEALGLLTLTTEGKNIVNYKISKALPIFGSKSVSQGVLLGNPLLVVAMKANIPIGMIDHHYGSMPMNHDVHIAESLTSGTPSQAPTPVQSIAQNISRPNTGAPTGGGSSSGG